MSNRLAKISDELVAVAGRVLAENNVTQEEYRVGINYLAQLSAVGELPLLLDVFLEHLVIKAEDSRGQGSAQTIEGPYFIEEVPWVTDSLKIAEEDNGEPLVISGRVTAPGNKAVDGAELFVWHSTPDGSYSGFHRNLPPDLYRGKLKTDADGRFHLRTTLPVPYRIPDQGPTGALITMMGRHTWRPAHVHFKIRKDGFREFTSQAYFEGGKWTDDDVAGGIVSSLIHKLDDADGNHLLNVGFVLDPIEATKAAA